MGGEIFWKLPQVPRWVRAGEASEFGVFKTWAYQIWGFPSCILKSEWRTIERFTCSAPVICGG